MLTRETFADGTFQAYTYNSRGELTSAQAVDGGITTYGYNAAGELTSVVNPSNQIESYTYNSIGEEVTRMEPNGSVTQYSYNAAGQIAELRDGAGNLITKYDYDALDQLVDRLDGNGQTTSYEYDGDGNVIQIVTRGADGTPTSTLNYTYNVDGRPNNVISQNGVWNYSYDAAGQLVHAVFTSTDRSVANRDIAYKYDAAGNRISTIFNGAVSNYTANGLNQYAAVDGTAYAYDADGNLASVTKDGVTMQYAYNSQNQLTAASGPTGSYIYKYDALGNMVSVERNGVISNYIIDPLALATSPANPLSAIAQVYDAAGNVSATYAYGNGLSAVMNGSGTFYYNADALGNVTSLSGTGGDPVETYEYAPFGDLLASTGSQDNPFQYGGALGIVTEADGLDLMRSRFYDPTIGRFMARDQINILGGSNLYEYAGNAPTYQIDPSGQYMFYGHFAQTFSAALVSGQNFTDAATLAYDTMMVDYRSETSGFNTGAAYTQYHAMIGKNDSGEYQTSDDTLDAVNRILRDPTVPLAQKMHLVQDAQVSEHFLKQDPGFSRDGLICSRIYFRRTTKMQ
jgi:RHS repeat-associated protein